MSKAYFLLSSIQLCALHLIGTKCLSILSLFVNTYIVNKLEDDISLWSKRQGFFFIVQYKNVSFQGKG